MSCSAKMRKLSVRIDADLKAAFEDTLRGIGVDPTCAMRSVYCQALADKIGVMISTLSAFRVPTSFSIPEIYQA